jgi:hypothetical protein
MPWLSSELGIFHIQVTHAHTKSTLSVNFVVDTASFLLFEKVQIILSNVFVKNYIRFFMNRAIFHLNSKQ